MRIAIIGSGYVGRFIYRILSQQHKCDIFQISRKKDIKKSIGLISNQDGTYHVWGGVLAIPNHKMAEEYLFEKKAVDYLKNYVQNNLVLERLYNYQESSILSVKVSDKISVPKIIKKTVDKIIFNHKTYFIDDKEYDEVIIATGSYSIPKLITKKERIEIKFEHPPKQVDKSIVIHKRDFGEWNTVFKKEGNDRFSYSIPIQLPVSQHDIPIVYNFLYLKLKNYKSVKWLYLLINSHRVLRILWNKLFGISYNYYFTTTNNFEGKEAIDYMKAYHYDASTFVEQKVNDNFITEYHNNDYTYLNPVSFRILSIINKLLKKEVL